MKGYYTATEYKGNVDGKYKAFPTDDEYAEYIREMEKENKND